MNSFYRIATALLLLLAVAADAASVRRYATISITGNPANGNTVTINGDIRTWKTTVADPTIELQTTNSVANAQTNLTQHLSAYPPSGPMYSYLGASVGQVVIAAPVDTLLVVSIGGGWATVAYSTNTVSTSYTLQLPFTTQTNTLRTNMMDWLAGSLNLYATTSLVSGSTIAAQLVGVTNTQTVTGRKTFSGVNIHTNTGWIQFPSGLSVYNTNGIIWTKNAGAVSTNTHYVLTGDSFGWPTIHDSGDGYVTSLPDDLGGILTLGMANAYFPLLTDSAHKNQWTSSNEFSGVLVTNLNIISGVATNLTINGGTISGNLSLVTNGTWTGGTLTSATVSSGTISGNALAITNGTFYTGIYSNATLNGTTTVSTNLSLTENTLTSLTSSNNAGVVLPTAFTRITSGPTAPFVICGITGGNNGRMVHLSNLTGYPMTIANESGADSTATNRILTGNGIDSSDLLSASLIYDGTSTRWRLIGSQRNTTAFGGLYCHDGVTEQTLTNAGTYYVLTSLNSTANSSRMTVNTATNTILTQYAGYYLTSFTISWIGTSSAVYEMSVFTNGVEAINVEVRKKLGTGTDVVNGSATGILNLPAGANVTVRAKGDGASNKITVQEGNLVMHRID